MTDLDKILKDPRSHRAVPETEMVQRVQQSALQAWKTQTQEQASQAEVVGVVDAKAKRRRIGPVHVIAMGLVIAALLVMISPHVPQLPRLDLLVKYGLYDLIDATALGMLYHPMQTAVLLAMTAAAIGFGLSSQARLALRQLF
jgi:hypothetical protein